MAGKILGIDMQGDLITAVKIEGRLRGYHVIECASVMMGDIDGLDEALKEMSKHLDLKADTYISTIPGDIVSYRNLQMPFKNTKKIKQTLSYEIETMVPFPVEDLVVDFTFIDQQDQSDILAASVGRKHISEYLISLQNYGIDPQIIDISGVPIVLWLLRQAEIPDDGILFQIGQKRTTMILYLKRRINLMRSFAFCNDCMPEAMSNSTTDKNTQSQKEAKIVSCFESFCKNVQNTLHSFEYQNNRPVRPEKIFITGVGSIYPQALGLLERFLAIPVEEINVAGGDPNVHVNANIAQSWNPATMDGALALTLRGNRQGLGLNFRKDEFEIKKTDTKFKREIRRASIFFLIILSLLITFFYIDYYFLKKRYTMLDKQITETFRQTLPDVKRIVDPVQQMKIKITQTKKSAFSLPGIAGDYKVVDILRDISIKVPESLNVTVTSMVVDPEVIKMKGETDTFNTVDIIKKGLEPSKYFSAVTISSANLDRSRKHVQFEIKLKRFK